MYLSTLVEPPKGRTKIILIIVGLARSFNHVPKMDQSLYHRNSLIQTFLLVICFVKPHVDAIVDESAIYVATR